MNQHLFWGEINKQNKTTRIPRPFATEIGLRQNSPVEMSLVEGRLVIVPVVEPALTLEHLLAKVSEDNLHGEIE